MLRRFGPSLARNTVRLRPEPLIATRSARLDSVARMRIPGMTSSVHAHSAIDDTQVYTCHVSLGSQTIPLWRVAWAHRLIGQAFVPLS